MEGKIKPDFQQPEQELTVADARRELVSGIEAFRAVLERVQPILGGAGFDVIQQELGKQLQSATSFVDNQEKFEKQVSERGSGINHDDEDVYHGSMSDVYRREDKDAPQEMRHRIVKKYKSPEVYRHDKAIFSIFAGLSDRDLNNYFGVDRMKFDDENSVIEMPDFDKENIYQQDLRDEMDHFVGFDRIFVNEMSDVERRNVFINSLAIMIPNLVWGFKEARVYPNDFLVIGKGLMTNKKMPGGLMHCFDVGLFESPGSDFSLEKFDSIIHGLVFGTKEENFKDGFLSIFPFFEINAENNSVVLKDPMLTKIGLDEYLTKVFRSGKITSLGSYQIGEYRKSYKNLAEEEKVTLPSEIELLKAIIRLLSLSDSQILSLANEFHIKASDIKGMIEKYQEK